jgi:hypothetical protein
VAVPRTARIAAVCIVSLLALEIASYGVVRFGFERFRPEYFAFDLDAILTRISDADLVHYRDTFYDAELGWAFHPGTAQQLVNSAGVPWQMHVDPDGARHNPYGGENRRIYVFGDSFTFGDEVNDDQTWPYFLSQATGSNVVNLGMGAYGTDQALLRLEQQLRRGARPEVVVLGILSENIRRIMGRYRLFYLIDDAHVLGFKPILHERDGRYEWLPNPLVPPVDRAAVARAFEEAKSEDFFYQSNRAMPTARFPYTRSLAELVKYAFEVDVLHADHLRHYGDSEDAMWRFPTARRRMRAIVERFLALGAQYGFQPVLLFFPTGPELERADAQGERPSYASFVDEIRAQHPGVPVVDVNEHVSERRAFNVAPFRAHPSEGGNRFIAQAVSEALARLEPGAARDEAARALATPQP